jgi:hypothetical protein
MYIFEIVCYVKSHLGKFEQNNAVHNYSMRQGLDLHVHFCRTNALKNGVMNIGIKLYNKIAIKIRVVENLRLFKRVFRSYLLQHTFYSVCERE